MDAYLRPGRFVDSDHPAVVAFAAEHALGANPLERAVALYYAVRDGVRYNPFQNFLRDDAYRGSACLEQGEGWCVPKAALLAAHKLAPKHADAHTAYGSYQAEVIDKVGTAASRESYPKLRAMFTTQWDHGPWSANYKLRFIGGTEEIVGGVPRDINEVFYNDISGAFTMDNGLFVRLGVDNVFDKQPPVSYTNLNINFDISTYDPVGRFMYAQLSWDFGG